MDRIGRYELLLELGRGAMGAVYQARDPQIDRIVAIKVILTQGLSPDELEGFKQRFYREARAAGKMSHPGIVTIHDIAEDEQGHPYLVMEFVEGSTLEDMVEQRLGAGERMPLEQALDLGAQVAAALDYAHRRGVVHRDVKPANILVTADGIAKIADFGIAKVTGVTLTQTGSFLGTPAFMSPEQFSGGAIDARSDLFSLGAMLYWVFTGERPFGGDTLTTVSFKIVFAYPAPVTQVNPALPADLNTVLMRCLAKNPEERYASCRDLAADLEAIKHGKPVAATPLPAQESIVNPAVVAAIPAGVTVTSTVASGPGASPTATVATSPRVSQDAPTTVMKRPPSKRETKSGLLGFLRARPLAMTMAALLLIALAAGGMWLWPGSNSAAGDANEAVSSPPTKKETSAPAPVEPARESSGPPPWSKGRGRGNRNTAAPVPMATLVLDVQHNFRDGTLEVLMDGKVLASLAMRGEVRNLGVVEVASGTIRRSIAVPAGQHVFTVRARENRGDYRGQEEIGATFDRDSTRILLVEFGKGSGFGVIDRKLTLTWK